MILTFIPFVVKLSLSLCKLNQLPVEWAVLLPPHVLSCFGYAFSMANPFRPSCTAPTNQHPTCLNRCTFNRSTGIPLRFQCRLAPALNNLYHFSGLSRKNPTSPMPFAFGREQDSWPYNARQNHLFPKRTGTIGRALHVLPNFQ